MKDIFKSFPFGEMLPMKNDCINEVIVLKVK